MKKRIIVAVMVLFLGLTLNAWAGRQSSPAISITGVVKQPLYLTLDDLARLQPVYRPDQ